jgi:hypothetical protein
MLLKSVILEQFFSEDFFFAFLDVQNQKWAHIWREDLKTKWDVVKREKKNKNRERSNRPKSL